MLVVVLAALAWPRAVFAATAPSITTQPRYQTILAGSNAVFTVVAGGTTPLAYQWSLNGTRLTNSTQINGAARTPRGWIRSN